jgi:hypothetical protein
MSGIDAILSVGEACDTDYEIDLKGDLDPEKKVCLL